MSRRKREAPKCANGCDAPALAPRFCICRACVDKITASLEAMVADGKRRAAEEAARKDHHAQE